MLGRDRRELCVPVVLTPEHHRQPPQRGEVHGLVEGALRNCAVAEEGDRDPVVGSELGRRRRADRYGEAGGDDAVGAEDPDAGVGDVHRAATTAVGAPLLAHQLREHAEGSQPLCQAMPVTAMGRRDHVGRPERPAGADGGGFLADRQVDEARHLPLAVEGGHALLEPSDQQHPAVHLEEIGGRERRP